MRLLIGLACASAALASPAGAQDPASQPPPVPAASPTSAAQAGAAPQPPERLKNPRFLIVPTDDDMQRDYPQLAHRKGLSGHARLRCLVTPQGDLDQCQVLSESPPGAGFGEASVKLAKIFRLAPLTKDGILSAGRAYEFGVTWRWPE